MGSRGRVILLWSLSLPAGALAGLIATGVLDSLPAHHALDRRLALHGLLLAWLLAYVFLWLLVAARERWRPVILVLLSTGLALGLAEGLVRWLQPYRARPAVTHRHSPVLHHRLLSSATMFSTLRGDQEVLVRTNPDGLRSHWTRASYRDRPFRVAVQGDSFVFGVAVQDHQSLPARLEVELTRLRPGLEPAVLNAGTISYSPLLGLRQDRHEVRHYAPHLVLYVLDPGDIGNDLEYTRELDGPSATAPFPPRSMGGWGYLGALHELARPWLVHRVLRPLAYLRETLACMVGVGNPRRLSAWQSPRVVLDGQVDHGTFFHYRHPLSATRRHFDRTRDYLRALADAVHQDGGRFALVLLPRYHHWSTRECPHNWERGHYRDDAPYRFELFRYFEEERGRLGFPVLNLLPRFRSTTEFPLVFQADPHFNERGNVFVAGELADMLIAEGLIPPSPGGPTGTSGPAGPRS